MAPHRLADLFMAGAFVDLIPLQQMPELLSLGDRINLQTHKFIVNGCKRWGQKAVHSIPGDDMALGFSLF